MISAQDEKLLSLLRLNARTSISDLARELNLSRSTVQNRIERLERTGVIKGYSVVYGGEFVKSLVSAHVLIKEKQELTAKTKLELQKIKQVTELYITSGEYDLIAVVQTQSLEQLSMAIEEIGALNGVERTNSSVLLETRFKR
ncbi:MAG: Lrp/AsnC family transcriptional regulator [Pseudomonadales bacterium]|jgi:DNA-binding Lrp family transcriptional regulator